MAPGSLQIPSPFPEDVAFYGFSLDASPLEEVLAAAPQADLRVVEHAGSEKRKKEFLLGRKAARLCLRRLGHPDVVALAKGNQGEPLWPAGIWGSISHSGSFVLACAAKGERESAIAIDIEDRKKKRSLEIAKQVCTAEERSWFDQLEDDSEKRLALLSLFSAKESIYKAYYPICGRYFGFQAVSLQLSHDKTSFTGVLREELHPELLPARKTIRVALSTEDDYVLTSLYEPLLRDGS